MEDPNSINNSDLANNGTATPPPNPAPAFDILALFAEVKERLAKVEADNTDMRGQIEAAKNRGEFELDLAQIKHVMLKYFPHDMPTAEPVPPPIAKFDPYTGAPLN